MSSEEMNREWREENARRVENIKVWYTDDGREDENHPKHGLYTGLAQLAKEGKLGSQLSNASDEEPKEADS